MAERQRLCWVDTKEKNHHPLWFEDGPLAKSMPGTFAYEGLRPQTRAQEFGDVWVELSGFNWLIVELKTWADFHASVRDTAEGRADTRLRHQLRGLLDLQARGFKTAVMLVGTLSPAGGKNPVGKRARGVYLATDTGRRAHRAGASWFEFESTRAAVQSLGILTYQAPSEPEVPHALRLLAELVEKQQVLEAPGLPAITTLGPRHSFLVTILTAVKGVGITDASAIAGHFGNFREFYEASKEDLREVRGIGKVMADRIWTEFHSFERDKALDSSLPWNERITA